MTTKARWMDEARTTRHARGTTIVEEGAVLDEWIAIAAGAVSLHTGIAGTRVAVATLWRGDLLGWGSPLGRERARFHIRAMDEVTALRMPAARAAALLPADELASLHADTDERLQEQIFLRLAGNGLQRLVSVLATLATALAEPWPARRHVSGTLALPLVQGCLGELSGLSRRQTWIYLGQLSQAGWVQTSRTRILLEGLDAWLALPAEVNREGLACIATLEQCLATLERLSRPPTRPLPGASIAGSPLTPAA